MTRRTSRTPSRTRCGLFSEPARPAGSPRPRPHAEDQPDLALEGGIPGLLAAAVGPARTHLTSNPVPATRKGAAPARSEPVPAPGTSGGTATRRKPVNQTPRPKTGTTQSVTSLGTPLNHRGQRPTSDFSGVSRSRSAFLPAGWPARTSDRIASLASQTLTFMRGLAELDDLYSSREHKWRGCSRK